MIDFLKSWIMNIVAIMIFITFLELLLPNSDMKKYIKMIVGLLVMLVIMGPILELTTGKVKIENEIFKNSSMIETKTLALNLNQFEGAQEKQMIELYKEKIESHIKHQIEYNNNVNVLSVHAEIEENKKSKEFGSIKKLNIVLTNTAKEQNIKPVSNIIVNIDREQQKNIDNGIAEDINVIEKIKENISDLYILDKETIHINASK